MASKDRTRHKSAPEPKDKRFAPPRSKSSTPEPGFNTPTASRSGGGPPPPHTRIITPSSSSSSGSFISDQDGKRTGARSKHLDSGYSTSAASKRGGGTRGAQQQAASDSLQTSLDAESLNQHLQNGSGTPKKKDHVGRMPVKMTQGQTPRNSRKQNQVFEEYFSLQQVQQGLKKGELIEGILRINAKSYEDAYISAPEGQMDIYIGGILDRNRALNGDHVVVQLKPQIQWKVVSDGLVSYLVSHDLSEQLSTLEIGDKPPKSPSKPPPNKPQGAKPPPKPQEPKTVEQTLPSQQPSSASSCDSSAIVNNSPSSGWGSLPPGPPVSNWNASPPDIRDDDVVFLTPSALDHLKSYRDSNPSTPETPEQDVVIVAPHELSENEEESDAESGTELAVDVGDFMRQIEEEPTTPLQTQVLTLDQMNDVKSTSEDVKSTSEDVKSTSEDVKSTSDDVKSTSKDVKTSEVAKKRRPRPRRNKKSKNPTPTPDSTPTSAPALNKKQQPKPTEKGPVAVVAKNKPSATYQFDVAKVMNSPNGNRFVHKTAKVVYISKPNHPRIAAGHVQLMQDRNPNWLLFIPRDYRVPRMMVPSSQCPPAMYQNPGLFKNVLYLCQIVDWKDTGFAVGQICQSLGVDGQIWGETVAILIENAVDFTEFPSTCYQSLPHNPQAWTIPAEEYKIRRDFRDVCVFTVDPSTCRDMDDALSCDEVSEGVYRVGVHIADVSYFVKSGTELDEIAMSRATSVYLQTQVIPMLPFVLSNELCSLNPGTDRLTFSVEWVIEADGTIREEWFGRTVIRSCSKLSYEHAQLMIDHPERVFKPEDNLPPICCGYGSEDVAKRVRRMHKLAEKLRKKRFTDGALRLDQVKLLFDVDPNGNPNNFSIYQHSESHWMIEEFMLLANMAVATKIQSVYPHNAVLRLHPKPPDKQMDDLEDLCAALGLPFDSGTAGSIQESLNLLRGDSMLAAARFQVMTHLCTKPMKLAKYFCSGSIPDESQFTHYALNVPLYTHFTSPIRRYPDILVHRLLVMALNNEPRELVQATNSISKLQKECDHSNDKKTSSKRVQELGAELYLALYIQNNGPFVMKAMVVAVLNHSADVLVLEIGVIKRVYTDKLPMESVKFDKESKVHRLILTWKSNPQEQEHVQQLTVFSLVDVKLEAVANEPLKFNAILLRPQINLPQ